MMSPVWSGRMMTSTCLSNDSQVLPAKKLGRTNSLSRAFPPGSSRIGELSPVRLGQATHRILGASLGLHRDDAETLAVGQPRVAVGRHHRAALMTKGHRADALLGNRLDERVGWENRTSR